MTTHESPRTPFAKYEGLGNDFVVIEGVEANVAVAEAQGICDRRRGVGADGILLVLPPRTRDAVGRMVVVNADGSVPEMCGNGLRCVALHLARLRDVRTLAIETDDGIKSCVVDDGGEEAYVTIDMGLVRVGEDVSIETADRTLSFALADAGNPHAISFSGASLDVAASIGPQVEKHARFERGTNVEFAHVRTPTEIDLVVWERGVGITQACGTGACATAAAAVAKGLSPKGRDIDVRLPGGTLSIRIDERGHAIMRGPARHVFSGALLGDLRAR